MKIPERQRQQPGDVDGNGVVDIQDLVSIASRFGQKGQNPADVNGDKTVDIRDLVLAAALMTAGRAAPSAYAAIGTNPDNLPLQPEDLQLWLTQAQRLDLSKSMLQRGVHVLGHLMEMLTPKRTHLLPKLSKPLQSRDMDTLSTYQSSRCYAYYLRRRWTLDSDTGVGHQSAGIYQSKSRAAYWDGRNTLGEIVASGIYFYTLRAGEFTATRKMLIRK